MTNSLELAAERTSDLALGETSGETRLLAIPCAIGTIAAAGVEVGAMVLDAPAFGYAGFIGVTVGALATLATSVGGSKAA